MHTEVFNNIDLLIDMADSKTNIDEMNTELIALKSSIKTKREEIEDLESIISDTRYFNASNELVDKNIEISLKNKISRLNRRVKEVKNSIAKVTTEEQKTHDEIKILKNKMEENTKYIAILAQKVKTSKNNAFYAALLKKEEKNNSYLEETLAQKNKEYEETIRELELNNQALKEINSNLENEKNRLNDILDNLKNPNAYIDEDLKNSDQEKLNKLKEELAKLEKRELELITDATMIGNDAKELVAKNNINEALEKVRELVTIVKTKPYMDITNPNILDEELEKKENERIELSNLIDSKNYEGLNSETINNRLEYLQKRIEENDKSIINYQNKINEIDDFINNILGQTITNLENESMKSEKTIQEYHTLLQDKNKNSKAKANIENAILKKEKEHKLLDHILASYKDDLLRKIEDTNLIGNVISRLEEENKNHKGELENLKNESLLNFKTKDLIEEEKDKDKLRSLNEEIKNIKNRKKYDKNPNEIYDQIEMTLATIKPSTILRAEKNKNIEIDNLFDTNPPEDKTSNRIKVIEMIPANTVKRKVEE